MQEESIQSLGGKARAESLSSERRREIAAQAAATKWALPVANFEGELMLGEKAVPCAVVEIDGQPVRLISSAGLMKALDRPWKGTYRRTERPNFIQAKNLEAFISDELATVLNAVEYRTSRGAMRLGYKAEMIPLVCEAYLAARDDGALTDSQKPTARACDLIMRGLARVGIMALVDEATGYQEVRDRMALARILQKYLISDGYRKWEKMFQLDYYREMFRLKGWKLDPESNARPGIVGKLTNNIIYDRMQPGILKKLKELNPKTVSGSRRHRHHQFFTGDVGVPELKEHLSNVVMLMKASTSWSQFMDLIDRAKPRVGDTLKLNI